MPSTVCTLCESSPYHVSDDQLLVLKDVRDLLFFFAALASPNTLEEQSLPLELKRAALAGSYELCARKLDGVVNAIVQWDRDHQARL
jgi:hypothetical protein